MIHFTVTVRTGTHRYQFDAIAHSSTDIVDAAVERFGVCSVTVKVRP